MSLNGLICLPKLQFLTFKIEFVCLKVSTCQEGDIKRYMNSQPDKDEAADNVYNALLPFLKGDECERVKDQLSDIAQDMRGEHLQKRNRGVHL